MHGNHEERKNRVLVELPERLRKAKESLKEHEDMFADLRALYAQRSILNDSTVLDQIGELIGAPPVPSNRAPSSRWPEGVGEGCPACGPGTQTGPFCSAHKWHERS